MPFFGAPMAVRPGSFRTSPGLESLPREIWLQVFLDAGNAALVLVCRSAYRTWATNVWLQAQFVMHRARAAAVSVAGPVRSRRRPRQRPPALSWHHEALKEATRWRFCSLDLLHMLDKSYALSLAPKPGRGSSALVQDSMATKQAQGLRSKGRRTLKWKAPVLAVPSWMIRSGKVDLIRALVDRRLCRTDDLLPRAFASNQTRLIMSLVQSHPDIPLVPRIPSAIQPSKPVGVASPDSPHFGLLMTCHHGNAGTLPLLLAVYRRLLESQDARSVAFAEEGLVPALEYCIKLRKWSLVNSFVKHAGAIGNRNICRLVEDAQLQSSGLE